MDCRHEDDYFFNFINSDLNDLVVEDLRSLNQFYIKHFFAFTISIELNKIQNTSIF